MFKYLLICELLLISSALYIFLHKKTRISLKFLFIDNLGVIIPVSFLIFLAGINTLIIFIIFSLLIPFIVIVLVFSYSMIRFWRTPNRRIVALRNEVVSPADGRVIYIKEFKKGDVPISIKDGLVASLKEFTGSELLNESYWLIGINMTPFDVHKNCAPISGKVIFNQHFNGEFLSLKRPDAILRNERNSLIIKNSDNDLFGIIQTASKSVRRIDSYVNIGDNIERGNWFGMIRFGSQVDVIIPIKYYLQIELGKQLYAGTSIIANK